MSGRRKIWLGFAAAVLVLAAALASGRPDDGTPLDPRSSGPTGLAGVVELLRDLQVHVDISLDLPDDTSSTVFVPLDLLNGERREAMLEWADEGGTLVVAGADARLHGLDAAGAGAADLFGPTSGAPECALTAMDEVAAVRHGSWQGLVAPEDPIPSVKCFPVGTDTAWLIAFEHGAGMIVALGSAEPFTNRYLGEEDNAVLAAALLGPAPGDRLVVVPRPPIGEGDVGVLDLVPSGFWRALVLLGAALLLAVVWRARRLGPPVAERLPPVLPSAELAHSVANLLHRAGDRATAAARLRTDARSTACRALRVPVTIGNGELAELLALRAGVAAEQAHLALVDRPVEDDATLMRIARACAHVRVVVRSPQSHPGETTASRDER